MTDIDLKGVEIDRYKRKQLEDFLMYKLERRQPLRFSEIQRTVGISPRQCEIIRSNNMENKQLQWESV